MLYKYTKPCNNTIECSKRLRSIWNIPTTVSLCLKLKAWTTNSQFIADHQLNISKFTEKQQPRALEPRNTTFQELEPPCYYCWKWLLIWLSTGGQGIFRAKAMAFNSLQAVCCASSLGAKAPLRKVWVQTWAPHTHLERSVKITSSSVEISQA